jgi:protein gp37
MAEHTGIEWCDHTINFWIGCTPVSAACDFCYAEAMAKRFGLAEWGHGKKRAKVKGAVATAFRLDRKAAKAGRRATVFCNSMSDLFDAEVPDSWRDEAFAVMALTPNLTWLPLTKRPKVMRDYVSSPATLERVYDLVCDMAVDGAGDAVLIAPGIDPSAAPAGTRIFLGGWPLPNVYLGTSVEDQKMADLRIPDLLATPATGWFISAEPLLSGIVLPPEFLALGKRAWCITGGESGPHARPMHPDWARSLRDQCTAAGVPFFFKQWGSCLPCGWDGEDEHGGIAYEIDEEHSSVDYDELGRAKIVQAHDRGFARFGHKHTGRRLDGREWSEVPGC